MTIGTALLGDDAGQAGGIQQRGIGRTQPFADQDGAFRQAGKAAERRARQVAHHAPSDFLDLVGAAIQPGQVLGRQARFGLVHDRLGDGVGLGHHGVFRRQQRFLDPLPHAADQARGAEHTNVCIYKRRDLRLAFLGQHRQPCPQLQQLLARLCDRRFQPRALGGDIGGLDLVAGDDGLGFVRAEHRADGDSGGDGDADEAPFGGGGLVPRLGGSEGGAGQSLMLGRRRVNPVH